MIDTLISAIEQRKEVQFTYSGLPRVAQPAAIGESATGNFVLRCYQVQGGHITPGHEWDLCYVNQIRDLVVTAKKFENDPPLYRRGDRQMRRIFAQL